MMILIVENNPLMRKMIRRLIEDLDPEIVECADGAESIRLFEKYRPNWILMDIGLPRLNGLSAMKEILARDSSARVIVITEHDDDATSRYAFESGAIGFFGKSDLRQLRKLISNQSKPK